MSSDPRPPMVVQLDVHELRGLIVSCVAEVVGSQQGESTSAPGELMTRHEAAEFLRCSLATLDRMVRDQGMPFRMLGDSKRFVRAELLDWLARPRALEAAE